MTLVGPSSFRVLLLPGWLNSEAAHWQSRWEVLHGDKRVEQNDWTWPRRGDWMARLDEVVGDVAARPGRPVVLVAHSLGCQLVAAWSAHSTLTNQVHAAMLVAPPDTERDSTPPQLHTWRPIPRRRLPFRSLAIISDDDPFSAPDRARAMANDWGSSVHAIGARGHINAASGLGDWPEGRRWLNELVAGDPRDA